MNAAFMRLERHERGIHAIEESAGPVSAVTGRGNTAGKGTGTPTTAPMIN
jgi:hypothetical protein